MISVLATIFLPFLKIAEATLWTLDTFVAKFVTFISDGILAVWGDLIAIILDQANFILILPVMVYLFVVATASLRSFYKG